MLCQILKQNVFKSKFNINKEGLCKRQRPAVIFTSCFCNRTSPSTYIQIKMSNTETTIPQQKLWSNIQHWLKSVDSQAEPEHHLVAINKWYFAFIDSIDADDQEIRQEITIQYQNMVNLFELLKLFPRTERGAELDKYLVS